LSLEMEEFPNVIGFLAFVNVDIYGVAFPTSEEQVVHRLNEERFREWLVKRSHKQRSVRMRRITGEH
jgi:hypothetical protein